MPAVRTATERECGRGPGGQPGAPWSWPRLPAPLALAGYRLAVIAAELALTGWLLGRTPLRTSESVLFSAFLGCAAACVEATRRWGAPPPGTRDPLSAWWLPAALLLPPLYALLAPWRRSCSTSRVRTGAGSCILARSSSRRARAGLFIVATRDLSRSPAPGCW